MKIDWHQHVHDGWRRSLGVFCITFAVAMSVLYFMDKKTTVTADTIKQQPEATGSPNQTLRPAGSSSKVEDDIKSSPSPTEKPKSGKIKLSTATQAQLEELPGIGPSKAAAIIVFRTKSGFKSVNDLDKVKGIGPATLEKLRPLVEL